MFNHSDKFFVVVVLLLLVIFVFCLFVFVCLVGFYFLLPEFSFLQLETITSDMLTGHLREKSHTVFCLFHI